MFEFYIIENTLDFQLNTIRKITMMYKRINELYKESCIRIFQIFNNCE